MLTRSPGRLYDFIAFRHAAGGQHKLRRPIMSKAHRGTPLKQEVPGSGRGSCPLCRRTGIKLLYEYEVNEKKFMLCKPCSAAVKRGKLKEAVAAL